MSGRTFQVPGQPESSLMGTLKANQPPTWPQDCPRLDCGTRMEFRLGQPKLARVCPKCGHTVTEADLLKAAQPEETHS